MPTLSERYRLGETRRELRSRSYGSHSDTSLSEELKRSVMAKCDVRAVLESWGCCPVLVRGVEWRGYCPDHVLHSGHRQHDQKWYMNAETGDSICFTSGKKSNLIYIAKRMWRLGSVAEAVAALTGGETLPLPPPDFVEDDDAVRRTEELEMRRTEELQKGIALIRRCLSTGGVLCDECLEYFARDGIRKETLDMLGVCSIESGYLEGRALIPFVGSDGEYCGYVAVMYKDKEWWVRKTFDKMRRIDSKASESEIARQYRKALYCPGFNARNHLYGLYEVLDGHVDEQLVLVEGERDAMKLLQEGVYCVSLHGTSVKDEQIPMIKSLNPRTLYLGFDMDAPGCIATRKAYDLLFTEMESVRVMNFPGGKDPKKFNAEELSEIISDADANTEANLALRDGIAEKDGK